MKRMLITIVMLAAGAAKADDARPVVRIPGRAEVERPSRTAAMTPQVVQVQGAQAAKPADPEPAPEPAAGGISLPVGSIVAWANVFSNQAALPRGWLPCNGQVVDDDASPLAGQVLPDLNSANGGEGRFLRGAKTAGATGGSSTHGHEGYRSQKYGTQRSPVAAPTPANHLPPYYDIIWIMRVR